VQAGEEIRRLTQIYHTPPFGAGIGAVVFECNLPLCLDRPVARGQLLHALSNWRSCRCGPLFAVYHFGLLRLATSEDINLPATQSVSLTGVRWTFWNLPIRTRLHCH